MKTLTTTSRRFHSFHPDLGPLESKLFQLGQQLTGTDLDGDLIEELAGTADSNWQVDQASERKLRWALSVSILSDILMAGGTVTSIDSALSVAWPDWATEQGNRGLRRALERLRSEMRYGRVSNEVIAALSPAIPSEQVLTLVEEGQFNLMEAAALHPSGASYGDIFSAARRYWTMPHRDREGRSRRFVLAVRHPTLAWPLPAGILEVGDASPMASERDHLLGLTGQALFEWLQLPERRNERLRSLDARLRALHAALRPIAGLRVNRARSEAQFEEIGLLEALAQGRSTTADDHTTKKRTAYLARLLRGLRLVTAMRANRPIDKADLSPLARLLRDLAIPRVTLELTLCGALPPFSRALVGKLMVAFAGDPRIRAICASPPGEILASVFDLSRLSEQLPSHGAVLLTTKGLFAHHSAQYQRSELPRRQDAKVRMKKIGETTGMTASLMSKRTYRLAQEFLDLPFQRRVVSDVFGSGGSKRQRRIEAAVSSLGVSEAIIHPGLQRPIYAVELALNNREVCILNHTPKWAVSTSGSSAYALEACQLWRGHWLDAARRRLGELDDSWTQGLREFIEGTVAHASV